MGEVTLENFQMLAEFVSGKMTRRNRQRSFWPLYSFDVIPLGETRESHLLPNR